MMNIAGAKREASIEEHADAPSAKVPRGILLAKYERTITELTLQKVDLCELPEEIIEFTSLQKLDLAHNKLKDLPQLPTGIKIMFFLNNEFALIPPSISKCKRLTMLSFKNNCLQEVSAGVLPLSVNW